MAEMSISAETSRAPNGQTTSPPPGRSLLDWPDLFRGARGGFSAQENSWSRMALWLLLAAVLFNPVVALINATIVPLGKTTAILAEVGLIGAAHVIIIQRFRPEMTLWYALIIFAVLFAATRSTALGVLDLKSLRDMMVAPTFVMLGMVGGVRRALQGLVILCLAVSAFILFESVAVDTYANFLDIKSFYINTRDIDAAEFTNPNSKLYVSADRPDERYFPFFGLHRMSSLFLEPVSLGNFTVLLLAVTVAFWPALSPRMRLFFLANAALYQFAGDGRLSATAAALIALAAMIRPMLPRNIIALALPGAILAALAFTELLQLADTADTLPGRIAYTAHLLAEMRVEDYLGASDRLIELAVDSGVTYLVITQSILGLLLFWIAFVVGLPERDSVAQRYKLGIGIYIAINMIISYSFISIKTAALLWFVYGALAVSRSARR